jgi:hypothetical protein
VAGYRAAAVTLNAMLAHGMIAATYGSVLRSDLQFVWGLGFIQ